VTVASNGPCANHFYLPPDTTTPAPHYSTFCRLDGLPYAQLIASTALKYTCRLELLIKFKPPDTYWNKKMAKINVRSYSSTAIATLM